VITLDPNWFKVQWNQARNRAGKRYTPDLDVSLPIYEFFESLGQDGSFFDRLDGLRKDLAKSVEELSSEARASKAAQDNGVAALLDRAVENVSSLAKMRPKAPVQLELEPVVSAAREAARSLEPVLAELRSAEAGKDQTEHSRIEYQIRGLQDAKGSLFGVEEFLGGPQGKTSNTRELLVIGPAGTGKTHLFCEMTRRRVEMSLPSLLFLGQAFRAPFNDPVEILMKSIVPDANPADLLAEIDRYARKVCARCILAIDAINEGDRESWAKALPLLVEQLRPYEGIALAISCRTPFQYVLMPDAEKLGFQTAYHAGYPADEQDVAIEKYFKAHGIPMPEVPLLEEEFSNPLFLKLFCEALEKVTVKKQHAQLTSIASGQRGMTHILEYFVGEKGRSIAKRLGIPHDLPWRFLKNVLAPYLAEHHSDSIPLKEARTLANGAQPAALAPGALLQALIEEDVLAEDVAFSKESGPQEVIRFTYQKFSDHLIARHLLSSQLDVTSEATIKESLRDPKRLGSYFGDKDAAIKYPNVAQAIMIEFPTRIRNTGELLDFVDWDGIPTLLCEGFVEGLYWREARSVNDSTGRWIGRFLGEESLKDKTLNVLLALSVKPQHPLNFKRLESFLTRMKLVERDLFWTEYLRKSRYRGTPLRILTWAEHAASKGFTKDFAQAYATVLKWFLTSTQRGFRDRATHALVHLGRTKPTILFGETLKSLSINDPYVPERMLSASYGVAMAGWQDPKLDASILKFARALFQSVFAVHAPHGTTHILARDYAQKTIELAMTADPNLLSEEERRLITPPFTFGGLRDWKEEDDKDKGKYRNGDAPLGMDFANYTLGRLTRGRSPYDEKNLGYQQVKKQILWRIYDLGYSLEEFSRIDQEIARESWYHEQRGRDSSKTDRYGKKYAWIAFYELAGYRVDTGLLDLGGVRISDADIDPSFPENSQTAPLFQKSWIEHDGSVRDWLYSNYRPPVEDKLLLPAFGEEQGPWVLLHGFVDRSSEDKNIFAFLDGILVRREHADQLIRILSTIDYPGNHAIPRPEEEYYTFAGEVPWADTWHAQQYPQRIGSNEDAVEVTRPIRKYSWESYHSGENKLGGAPFLTKEIAEDLNLYVQIPTIRMAERNSAHRATVTASSGEAYRNSESILFIRQDLLDRFLERQGLNLILFAWGERRANYHAPSGPEKARELEGDFRVEEVLHRQGFLYTPGAFRRFL
jgi:hypothetical protein